MAEGSQYPVPGVATNVSSQVIRTVPGALGRLARSLLAGVGDRTSDEARRPNHNKFVEYCAPGGGCSTRSLTVRVERPRSRVSSLIYVGSTLS